MKIDLSMPDAKSVAEGMIKSKSHFYRRLGGSELTICRWREPRESVLSG